MTKNQKMLLGIGAVAVAGYLIWKNQQTTSFAGPVGKRGKFNNATGIPKCPFGCTWNATVRSCMCGNGPTIPSGPNNPTF